MEARTAGGWRAWLGDENRFWLAGSLVVGVLAVGKGLRYPVLWGATAAQVDYQFGFIKRGLFGAALNHALGLEHYVHFALLSFSILAGFLGLLALYTAKSGVARRVGGFQAVALFASCYSVTYFAHLVGYSDLLLGCLAMGLLLVRDARWRLAAAIPVTVAGLMIHEIFLLIFVPVLMLSFLLQAAAGRYSWRAMGSSAAVLGAVGVAVTVGLAAPRPRTPEEAQAMYARAQARADFQVMPQYFNVFALSAEENARIMRGFHRQNDWWATNLSCVVIFGPTLLLLAAATRKVFQAAGVAGRYQVVAAAAVLSPLLLHMLGWDNVRWNAWTVVLGYLVLLTVCFNLPGVAIELSPAMKNVIVMVMMVNMATGGFLMDKHGINNWPFFLGYRSLRYFEPWRWLPPTY